MTRNSSRTFEAWGYVSFAESDRDLATRICREIERWRVPEPYRSLLIPTGRSKSPGPVIIPPPESRVENKIALHRSKQIHRARFFLLIASPEAAGSSVVEDELASFLEVGSPGDVLVIGVRGCSPAQDDWPMPEPLRQARTPLAVQWDPAKGFSAPLGEAGLLAASAACDWERSRRGRLMKTVTTAITLCGLLAIAAVGLPELLSVATEGDAPETGKPAPPAGALDPGKPLPKGAEMARKYNELFVIKSVIEQQNRQLQAEMAGLREDLATSDLQLALRHREEGNYREALARLQQSLTANPGSAEGAALAWALLTSEGVSLPYAVLRAEAPVKAAMIADGEDGAIVQLREDGMIERLDGDLASADPTNSFRLFEPDPAVASLPGIIESSGSGHRVRPAWGQGPAWTIGAAFEAGEAGEWPGTRPSLDFNREMSEQAVEYFDGVFEEAAGIARPHPLYPSFGRAMVLNHEYEAFGEKRFKEATAVEDVLWRLNRPDPQTDVTVVLRESGKLLRLQGGPIREMHYAPTARLLLVRRSGVLDEPILEIVNLADTPEADANPLRRLYHGEPGEEARFIPDPSGDFVLLQLGGHVFLDQLAPGQLPNQSFDTASAPRMLAGTMAKLEGARQVRAFRMQPAKGRIVVVDQSGVLFYPFRFRVGARADQSPWGQDGNSFAEGAPEFGERYLAIESLVQRIPPETARRSVRAIETMKLSMSHLGPRRLGFVPSSNPFLDPLVMFQSVPGSNARVVRVGLMSRSSGELINRGFAGSYAKIETGGCLVATGGADGQVIYWPLLPTDTATPGWLPAMLTRLLAPLQLPAAESGKRLVRNPDPGVPGPGSLPTDWSSLRALCGLAGN